MWCERGNGLTWVRPWKWTQDSGMLRWTIVNFHHIIQSRLEEGKLAEDHYQDQTCKEREREKGSEKKITFLTEELVNRPLKSWLSTSMNHKKHKVTWFMTIPFIFFGHSKLLEHAHDCALTISISTTCASARWKYVPVWIQRRCDAVGLSESPKWPPPFMTQTTASCGQVAPAVVKWAMAAFTNPPPATEFSFTLFIRQRERETASDAGWYNMSRKVFSHADHFQC